MKVYTNFGIPPFSSLIAGTSSFLITTGAYTFRNYGPLYPFTALLILYYIKRFDHVGDEKWSDCVKYGLIMVLLSYTHYFGILTICAFFLADMILFFRRKISWKCGSSYFLAGVLFIPWFLVALSGATTKYNTFWPSIPTLKTLYDLSIELCSNIKLVWFAVILGCFAAISGSLREFINQRSLSKFRYYHILLVYSTIFVIMVAYVYSADINPSRSVFVSRYFISVLPMVHLLAAVGIDNVLAVLVEHQSERRNRLVELAVVFLFVFLSEKTLFSVKQHAETIYEAYEQAADWIYDQPDAHRNDALIVASTAYVDGWEYYLSHNGQRPGLPNVILPNQDFRKLDSVNIVYVHTAHWPVEGDTLAWLDQNFEITDENLPYSVKKYERK